MTNEEHKKRILNLLESLSELAGEDLEIAKEILRAAGKDPDEVVKRGMEKLTQIQKKYSKEQPVSQDTNRMDEAKPVTYILCLDEINKRVFLSDYVNNCNALTVNEVFETFIRKQSLRGTNSADLQVDSSIDRIKFLRLVRHLYFVVSINASGATVRPIINTINGDLPVTFPQVESIVKLGYFILPVNANDKLWMPVDQEAVSFAVRFLKDIGSSDSLTTRQALNYFSKRSELRWVKFEPEELDLDKVFDYPEFQGVNRLFTKDLYDYQKDGLKWLHYCCLNGIGGILGDDMGLGKTAQIISAIAAFLEKDIYSHILIVVPSTLLENWRREFAFFTPSIVPYLHHGNIRSGSITELSKHKVVITSYSMIINDVYLFNKIDWDLLIADEASLIKNYKSQRKISLGKIPAKVRIAMTGTPVENSLSDLWSIADFVLPGYLGSREEFNKRYVYNSVEETLEKSNLLHLKSDTSYIMLRRKKEDVLESLPDRIDIHQALQMSDDEASKYEDLRTIILEKASGESPEHIFSLIQHLRQFTTHPLLSDKSISDAEIDQMMKASVKFKRTFELITEIKNANEKVLVFTEYLDMIDAMKRAFGSYFSTSVFTIDGRVPTWERQANIDLFSAVDGFSIMILNPQTGGMGLNITSANHVIHYTRQWNPALEEQSSARAYRNGQKKAVNLYYLFYADTIEEVIDDRLKQKRKLAGEVIAVTENESGIDEYLNALNKSPLNKIK